MNRMRGENKGSRDDGSAVGVGGHSNGFTGSGDVDSGQDTKVHYTYLAHITLDNKVDLVQVYFSILKQLQHRWVGWLASSRCHQGVGPPWSVIREKLLKLISYVIFFVFKGWHTCCV